jgi:4-amino-4-deoxy-L-arabinose transferase-like glycosyltransferase
VAALLAATLGLYTAGLPASGWGNSYYAAAAQAGARSWRVMLFGGLDPVGGITVDKPPAALWPMSLSVRMFGLSPLTVLLPQALMGVASVALMYATVRRQAQWLGDRDSAATDGAVKQGLLARAAATGLLAAAVLAVTPVATLMARYDNPDELMVLLLVAASYGLVRSVEAPSGGGGWLAVSGALLGFAFLTKLLQAWLVLPAFLLVALVAGAGPFRRRVLRVVAAGAAMVATAGWWVLLVQLTPTDRRPWIGSTQTNSVLDLTLGYNGVGRLTGQEAGGGASNVSRPPGWVHLLGSWAPAAMWLVPAALVALGAAWWLTRGWGRRDPRRAGLLLWGSWLIVVLAVLASLRGISHGYYTMELAPAVSGGLALGAAPLWRATRSGTPRWAGHVLVAGVSTSALWAVLLLVQHPSWPLALAPVVLGSALIPLRHVRIARRGRPPVGPAVAASASEGRAPGRMVLAATALSLLAAPTAWSVATAQAVHHGANVVSGPATSVRSTTASGPAAGFPVSLVDHVRAGAVGFDWGAAVVGHRAADLQLAARVPVWALGGFSGHDPYPRLAEFITAARHHRVHYLLFTAADQKTASQAGLIARWAAGCLPVHANGPWILVDASRLAHPAAACGAARPT